MADPFTFELVSPERLVLSEDVIDVVVPGAEGFFDVYKDHAPFVSTLAPGVLTANLPSGASQRVFVRGGFAEVNPDGLTVLAEEAIPVSELDPAAVAQRIQDAKEDIADAKDDATRLEAETRLARLTELQQALGA